MSNSDELRRQAIAQALNNAGQRSGSEEYRILLQKWHELASAITEQLNLQKEREILERWLRK